jgi:hypothetical protein
VEAVKIYCFLKTIYRFCLLWFICGTSKYKNDTKYQLNVIQICLPLIFHPVHLDFSIFSKKNGQIEK